MVKRLRNTLSSRIRWLILLSKYEKRLFYKANQIFWGFVTWGFKLGDKLGGLIIKK